MEYQVFLSFRGADTRHNFTSHLLEALKKSGVNVFFDEEKLEKGKEVAPALSTAIAATNISVIILSKNYASSNSCLDELCDIMNLRKTQGHTVLPIFYHVDPSDVKNVDGSFQTSFEEHRKSRPAEKVDRWENAFSEVGNLEGNVIKGDKDDRPETEFISNIVDFVKLALTKHQIFLSFGEKTRRNFANHLHKALERRGLNVVVSNGTLEEKSQAIANSDISIIILSDDYASSEACLAEAYEIMNRKEIQEQIVLPIFYKVNPSDVRGIRGSFETDFGHHEFEGKHQVQQWKSAFVEVGKIKGWHIEGLNCDRSEPDYIKDVAEDVIVKLNSKSRSVSERLVGIYDQKEKILDLIKQDKNRVIGLWGPGGIGKTTLAEAVYNEMSPKFEKRCFVQNVGEEIAKKGIESLKNELFSKLLRSEIRIETPSVGCSATKDRLKNSKVLVVLDGVSSFQHVDGMDIKHFGGGSKIIVTSRERQVLARADEIHEVEGLSDDHSFQLFLAFAFKQLEHATDEFLTVSSKFLRYAQGSPLALRIMGSHLCGQPIKVWESEAAKLGEYGNPEILTVLERSYHGLGELEKKIFLDIAIFFIGDYHKEMKECVEAFLSSCYGEGYFSGVTRLVDKCLLEIITIDNPIFGEPYQCFYMHDMVAEMGKYIESEDHSGKHRRLWRPEDVNPVLSYNHGANSIEGIKSVIDDCGMRQTVFQSMSNLRFIQLFSKSLPRVLLADAVDIEPALPQQLRYLEWRYYPFKSLSSTFNPVNLVILKLYSGKMERIWNGDQVPFNLRVLEFTWCEELVEIPNLSRATKLKTFICVRCTSLVKVAGLEHLASLEELIFSFCQNLREIPSLLGATKLKILDCKGCTSLDELPSLDHLTSLEELIFFECKKLGKIPSLSGAKKLKTLDCSGCISLVELSSLNHLASLEKLTFYKCINLRKIPSLSGAKKLKTLNCKGCKSLVELSSLNHLASLESLDFLKCENLRMIPSLSGAKNLNTLNCGDCISLVELPSLNHLTSLRNLHLSDCDSLKKFPEFPSTLSRVHLSGTGIEEVSASIENLIGLKELEMSYSEVKKVSRNISKLDSLQVLSMRYCSKLEILPQLPPNLVKLDARNCKSLTQVSFKVEDPNLLQLDDTDEIFYNFSNCSLKPKSVRNIVENVIHKIKCLAMGRLRAAMICCLPKKEIPANNFEFQSESYSLTFEIDKTVCSPSKIFAFAICLVVDLTCLQLHHFKDFRVVCEYRLTALTAAGQDKDGQYSHGLDNLWGQNNTSDHVLILFGNQLIFTGEYKKASFTFYCVNRDSELKKVMIKKCGVHVFPVDLRGSCVPFPDTDEMSSDEYKDARSEEVHEDSATKQDLSPEEIDNSDELSSDEYQDEGSKKRKVCKFEAIL